MEVDDGVGSALARIRMEGIGKENGEMEDEEVGKTKMKKGAVGLLSPGLWERVDGDGRRK